MPPGGNFFPAVIRGSRIFRTCEKSEAFPEDPASLRHQYYPDGGNSPPE